MSDEPFDMALDKRLMVMIDVQLHRYAERMVAGEMLTPQEFSAVVQLHRTLLENANAVQERLALVTGTNRPQH